MSVSVIVRRPGLTLLVILSAIFVQLLNASIVYIAVPGIQASFETTPSQVQFVLVGYQLGFACTLITGARLGDIFGRRRMFIVGMVAFTLLSVVCSLAGSIDLLIIARIAQGVASGLMFPQVLSFIQVMYPPDRRGGPLGAYGAAIGLGSILGPTIGGALIQLGLFPDPWRAIFLVNVPIGIAAAVAAAVLLPTSTAAVRPRLDLLGVALSAAGLGLTLAGLGTFDPPGSLVLPVALFVAGLALLAVFVAYQRARSRADRTPLLDTTLFRHRTFAVGMLLSFVFYAGVPAFFLVLSLYLLDGQGFSPLLAGLATLPYAVGTITTSILADSITARVGRRVLTLGAGVLAAGMLLLAVTALLVGDGQIGWWLIPALLLGGLGFGLFVPPLTDFVLAGVPETRASDASGAITSLQQIGGAVGVTLISIVLFTVLSGYPEADTAAYAAAVGAGLVFLTVLFVIVMIITLALPRTVASTTAELTAAAGAQNGAGR